MLFEAIYPKPIEVLSWEEIYIILFFLILLSKIKMMAKTKKINANNTWELYQTLRKNNAPLIQMQPLLFWLQKLDKDTDSSAFSSNLTGWQKGLFSTTPLTEQEWQACVKATQQWLKHHAHH